ncbi:L,D-transpeptidase [Rhizobium sp. RU20A]|uniref:L,D-transpeptidase n=1 Tax=Rhizobium sp. RU20A TaxID=1907412 RepID=UPI0032AFAEEC
MLHSRLARRFPALAGLALALSLAPLSGGVASANDRYANRPPVIVSPDLAAPWLLQLGVQDGQVRPVYRERQRAATRYQTRQYQQGQYQQGQYQQGQYRQGQYQQRRGQPMDALPGVAVRRIDRAGVALGGQTVRQPSYGQPRAGQQMDPQQVAAITRAEDPARRALDPKFLPQTVAYETAEKPGTIVIDTNNRFLYLVEGNGEARRYGVGVGKPGFEWAGAHKVTRKAEWPDWHPPQEMIAREAAKGHFLPARMEGGPQNPLGARALYLGSTLYRIHGTNAPWTIGYAVSSGCIRMRNEDVTDLYERVNVGARVIVQ